MTKFQIFFYFWVIFIFISKNEYLTQFHFFLEKKIYPKEKWFFLLLGRGARVGILVNFSFCCVFLFWNKSSEKPEFSQWIFFLSEKKKNFLSARIQHLTKIKNWGESGIFVSPNFVWLRKWLHMCSKQPNLVKVSNTIVNTTMPNFPTTWFKHAFHLLLVKMTLLLLAILTSEVNEHLLIRTLV